MTNEASFAARQQADSDRLATRADFPGWPTGPRISHLPIRRMRRRSKINSDGCQFSRKHPLRDCAMIDADSDAELDFLMFAELDPCTTFIVAQPTRLTFANGDRVASHVPDFAIIRNGCAEIIEVKGILAASKPSVQALLASAERYVTNWPDWRYLATTTTLLLQDRRRPAVEILWRHLRPNYSDLQVRAVRDLLARTPMMLGDVMSALFNTADAPSYQQLLSMAATARIWIDFESPIGPHSLVRHPDPNELPDSILPCLRPGDPEWR